MKPEFNPCRSSEGPAWRWNQAEEFRLVNSRHLSEPLDEYVHRARHYKQLCSRGERGEHRAKALYPAFAVAETINKDCAKVGQMKIAVLGNLDGAEVARRFNLDEAAVEVWEACFFDVRGMREAISWMYAWVIRPESDCGDSELAARLKLAFVAGPAAARAILDADTRVPVDEGQRLFDRRLKLDLKFDAAMEMPIRTDREKMFFVGMYSEMRLKETGLEVAERRLAQRCQEARNRHELSKIRLQAAQERAARKAAATARRKQEREFERLGREQLIAQRRARALVESQAAAARVASSPLAQLQWHLPKDYTRDTEEYVPADRVIYQPGIDVSTTVCGSQSFIERGGISWIRKFTSRRRKSLRCG